MINSEELKNKYTKVFLKELTNKTKEKIHSMLYRIILFKSLDDN